MAERGSSRSPRRAREVDEAFAKGKAKGREEAAFEDGWFKGYREGKGFAKGHENKGDCKSSDGKGSDAKGSDKGASKGVTALDGAAAALSWRASAQGLSGT